MKRRWTDNRRSWLGGFLIAAAVLLFCIALVSAAQGLVIGIRYLMGG